MRRFKQALTELECINILENATSGVLSLISSGFPYGVPLNFIYLNNSIYFHSAKVGKKIEAIKENPNASFTVIYQDEIVPLKLTSYFRSVIVFGKAKILTDETKIKDIMLKLGRKYAPNLDEERIESEINKAQNHFSVFKLEILKMTGKQAIELVNKV